MKKISTLLIFSLLGYTLTAQTVRRVNGDPSITGVNVYNTIQAAVDAANTDDIILIEPYGQHLNDNPSYNDEIHIDKRLHFRGNGYNLESPNLNLSPLDKRDVIITHIHFELGSSGSTIKNLNITGELGISSANVTIESCYLRWVRFKSLENSSNVIAQGINCNIRKCLIFYDVSDVRGSLSKANSNLNCTIENSHFRCGYGYIGDLDNSIFKNCFISQVGNTDNSIFTNCIFSQKIVGLNGGANYNNASSYCLSFETDLPALGNNQNNIVWQQVFKGDSYCGEQNYQLEKDMELSSSSIAKNAGINGGDIGIYGGTYPYEKSGLPHHPISTFFINSGIGNNDIDIDAVITIKAN